MIDTIDISIMLGTYPKTDALKNGSIGVAGANLNFADVDSAQTAFKRTVNDLEFDISELAIATFLQAKSVGRPLYILPFVMNGMFHHKSLYRRAVDDWGPEELAGKRIAMRSYSQTTPTWVRGFLMEDYGVKVDDVKWMVGEGGHVSGLSDPAWVYPLESDKKLPDALAAGEVDAIMAGAKIDDDRLARVFPDPQATSIEWYQKHQAVPINHMICVTEDLANNHPGIVRGVYGALIESKYAAEGEPKQGELVLQPNGFANVKNALEIVARYAVDQALIAAPLSLDELYGPIREILSDVE